MKKILFSNVNEKVKSEVENRPVYVFYCRECGTIFMAEDIETSYNYHLETRETGCPVCDCKVSDGQYLTFS